MLYIALLKLRKRLLNLSSHIDIFSVLKLFYYIIFFLLDRKQRNTFLNLNLVLSNSSYNISFHIIHFLKYQIDLEILYLCYKHSPNKQPIWEVPMEFSINSFYFW